MDYTPPADDPQLSAAMAQLDSDIASETATDSTPTPEPTAVSATPVQPAPVPAKTDVVQTPKPGETPGTPAAKDQQPITEPSKYEKAKLRQTSAWEQINKEKAEVRALADSLKAQREELEKSRVLIESDKAKARAPKFTPEDYEAYAKQADDKGEFDLAEKARARAAELRANPPKPNEPTDSEKAAKAKDDEEKLKAAQKEWWGKAGVDFPSVVKPGTPENETLKQLIASEPNIVNDPKGMYYAARLVNAETSAARVPTLSKDLDAANAKIKELEGKLTVESGGAPTSGAGAVTFEQMPDEQQFAALEREARAMTS